MHAKWVVVVVVELVLFVLLWFAFLSNWWRLYAWYGRQSQLIDSSLAYVVRFKSRKFVYNFVFVWCCCYNHRRSSSSFVLVIIIVIVDIFIVISCYVVCSLEMATSQKKTRHHGEKQMKIWKSTTKTKTTTKQSLLFNESLLPLLPRNFIVREAHSVAKVKMTFERKQKKMILCTIHSFTFIIIEICVCKRASECAFEQAHDYSLIFIRTYQQPLPSSPLPHLIFINHFRCFRKARYIIFAMVNAK